MSRLSIFSSDTLHLRVRGLLPTLAIVLLAFVFIDTGVRITDPLKTYGGWENPWLQYKINSLKAMVREHGRVDVMLLSSSIGLETEVAVWQEACGNNVICYNAGMGGGHPQWNRFMFEKVYYPQAKPTHLVYCICPRDVNMHGNPAQNYYHLGPLWESHNVRRLTATSFKDKAYLALEEVSFLFRTRRFIRRYLQQGPIAQDTVEGIQANGTLLPTVRRIGNNPVTEEDRKAPDNHYAQFSMPPEGDIAELVALDRFCKEHGVKFVLVNQQVAPRTYGLFDNPKEDYEKYLAGLRQIEQAGVRVVDMAQEMPLTHREFSDDDHMNRWGGYAAADFLFRKIVRPWFADKALVEDLPKWVEIPLVHLLGQENHDFYAQDRSRIPPAALYSSELQVVTDRVGGALPIKKELPKARYAVDLYGADERTTRTANAPQHKLAWVEKAGGRQREVPFELSRETAQGAALTRMTLDINSTSSLDLQMKALAGTECVLDTVFFRERVDKGRQLSRSIESYLHDFGVDTPMLVRNNSFEFADKRLAGYAAEWAPYTADRKPWGPVQMDNDAHEGRYSLRLQHDPKAGGWGCVVVQRAAEQTMQQLRGKRLTVSAWVKTNAGRFFGAVAVRSNKKGDYRLPDYNGGGSWQKLSVDLQVEKEASGLQISIGAVSQQSVLVDDVRITVHADLPTTTTDIATTTSANK